MRRSRAAFTLVEAVVALAVVATGVVAAERLLVRSTQTVAVARAVTGDRFCTRARAGAVNMVHEIMGISMNSSEVCQVGARTAKARPW